MSRPSLEVADIFRDHGRAWVKANAGHISLTQLKVMSAITRCRTSALGGHVSRCENEACGHTHIAYNSCRNRHCPKCQGSAARDWLEERQAELLPVPYFHLVFTLPSEIADLAYQNKRVLYGLLFKASAEAMQIIAADPKHLGANIAITSVLHTWGSAMTHHPHVHMIVPGGGVSMDGKNWIACRKGFFLPVRALSKLFRRLMLEKMEAAFKTGKLNFYGKHTHLAQAENFKRFIKRQRRTKWFVYAKKPFAGPEAVLTYLSRYTHRVAISNRRLVSADQHHVAFRYKNYRADYRDRWQTMRLTPSEFIRRFLIHVLPKGFHRIRHYGLFASSNKADNLKTMRALLKGEVSQDHKTGDTETASLETAEENQNTKDGGTCPCCGGRMIIIETFDPGCEPRHKPKQEGPEPEDLDSS